MPKANDTSIFNYDTVINFNDYLFGSDADNNKKNKSYRIGDLAAKIIENIGLSAGNNILTGGVFWLENLDFTSSVIQYFINGIYYSAPARELITLSPADATYSRIDVFAVTTDNVLIVLEGIPAVDPLEPTVNFATQIKLTTALIPALATEPSGVARDKIYDENTGGPTEWVATENTSGVNILIGNTEDPQAGTKAIKFYDTDPTGADILKFTNTSLYNLTKATHLQLYIKLNQAWDATDKSNVSLFKDNAVIGAYVNIQDGVYGFDKDNITDYQTIILPLEDFGLTDVECDEIRFSTIGASAGDVFYMDNFSFVYDNNIVIPDKTWIDLIDTLVTDYVGKAGYASVLNENEAGWILERLPTFKDIYPNNILIDGSAVPDGNGGLVFNVVVSSYIMNGNLLPSTIISTTVTLSTGDASFARKDLIVVNEDETISVIEGVPATNPAEPPFNYATQLVITVVDIAQLATAPTGITDEVVYANNEGEPGEWTTTESTSGNRIDINSLLNPDTGLKSILTQDLLANDYIDFINDAPVDISTISALAFRMRLQASWHFELHIGLYDNGTLVSGNHAIVTDRSFGLNSRIINAYQTIQIPIEYFHAQGDFDTIRFIFSPILRDGIHEVFPFVDYDNLRLIKGGDNHTASDTLIGHTDTPNTYVGQGSKILAVKDDETGVTFIEETLFNPSTNTYYIDSALPNSDNSVKNNEAKAFHDITSVIAALPADDGTVIEIFFLSSGNHTAMVLPSYPYRWNARTTATISFSGIGGVVQDALEVAGNVVSGTHFFVDGKVSVLSNTPTLQQKWAAPTSGHIGLFTWNALTSTHITGYRSFNCGDNAKLKINNLSITSQANNHNPYNFGSNSEIELLQLTLTLGLEEFRVYTGADDSTSLYIHDLNLVGGPSIELWDAVKTTVKKITGTGTLKISSESNFHFKDCVADASVSFQLGGAKRLSGKLTTTGYISTMWRTDPILFENFTGKVDSLGANGAGAKITFKGANYIECNAYLSLLPDVAEALTIEDGVTSIKTNTPATEIFQSGGSRTSIMKGLIKTNCTEDLPTIAETLPAKGENVSQFINDSEYLSAGTFFSKESSWIAYGGGFSNVGIEAPSETGTMANLTGLATGADTVSKWHKRRAQGGEVGFRQLSRYVCSLGGIWRLKLEFNIDLVPSGVSFFGLSGTAALLGNVDPSTLFDLIGIASDDSDTNLQFIHNDNLGSAVKADLGANFLISDNPSIRLEIRKLTATSQIDYKITNLDNDTVIDWTSVSSNLPSDTVGLYPQIYGNIGTGSGTNNFHLSFLRVLVYEF